MHLADWIISVVILYSLLLIICASCIIITSLDFAVRVKCLSITIKSFFSENMHVVLVLIIDNDYLGCKFWSLYTTVCISLR